MLDTQAFIWFVTDNPNLSLVAKELIEKADNQKFLSMASVWEMAIKQSIGKQRFSLPLREFIDQQLKINNTEILPIELNHIEIVGNLPLYHRDPFDRPIIAQAIVEKMTFVSSDSAFDAYSIQRRW